MVNANAEAFAEYVAEKNDADSEEITEEVATGLSEKEIEEGGND